MTDAQMQKNIPLAVIQRMMSEVTVLR